MSVVVKANDVSVRFILQHQRARSFQDALIGLVHRTSDSSEEFWALRRVSFEVAEGEALGIVGQNGSGKSTLLKLLTRILEPTSGDISVKGKVSALIELGAGFHPDLTGRENIYLNGSILGFGRKEMDRRFDEILAFSELERFIDTPVKHYSSGMYMRLGFAVAVSVDPTILIIDEVLSVGDGSFQAKCMDRIHEFRRNGKTIIFVSHGLQVVEQLCDRVVWLDHGIAREQGPSASTIRSYAAELRRHDAESRETAHNEALVRSPSSGAAKPSVDTSAIEIRSIRFHSSDGRESYSIRCGDGIVVQVQFRTQLPVSDYVLSLELRRHDGLLLHTSSQTFRDSLPVDASGEGEIEIEFASLPLLAGTYDLTPRLTRTGHDASSQVKATSSSFAVWGDANSVGIVPLAYRLRTSSGRVDALAVRAALPGS